MPVELEAKVKVDCHDEIIDRLKALGARFQDTVRQVDQYYDFSDHKLLDNDSGLRIRSESKDGCETAQLCFKGPRHPAAYKRRQELETAVGSSQITSEILQQLGLAPRLTIEKHRQHWQWNDCLICLDQVNHLGCFVEIEGPDERKILDSLQQLELADLQHLQHGYARMMAQFQSRQQDC